MQKKKKKQGGIPRMASDAQHGASQGHLRVLLTHLHQCSRASLFGYEAVQKQEEFKEEVCEEQKKCCSISVLEDFCRIWGSRTCYGGLLFIVGHTTGF